MNTKNVNQWFEEQQNKLAIEVKEIPMSEANEWNISFKDNIPQYVGHISGNYHRGVFLKAWDAFRKEWVERFLIAPIPPKDGEVLYGVILMARLNDKYLVQAKAEPGNNTKGHVQVTSTIHASYTNIKMGLSGSVPFTWMFDDPRCIQYIVPQDGAQLYLKNNKVCFIDLDEEPLDIPDNFAWATLNEIFDFAKEGLVCEHVFQCLGVSLSKKQ